MEATDTTPQPRKPRLSPTLYKRLGLGLASVIALVAVMVGYLYLSSPAAIRQPKVEHAHFRLQLIVGGTPVNFGQGRFQIEKPGGCSADIPDQPIHFHDNKDQFVHLHWKKMTGGLLLKDYGWNLIGGPDNTLGYRFDQLPKIKRVAIYGKVLPAMPDGAKLWIYSGDDESFRQRTLDDFLHQDAETFFGVKSNVNTGQTSWLNNLIFAKASAHGADHAEHERLQKLNNLLGNVVIYAQKDAPKESDVAMRFGTMLPLTDSTCGG